MPPTNVLVHPAPAWTPLPRSRDPELQMSVPDAYESVVLNQASEQPRRDSDPQDRPSASRDWPTWRERLGETEPLISAPAFFGPPVVVLLAPWLLLVLLLVPPAALLITLVVVVLLGAGLLAVLGMLIASPYLVVRHLRARHRLGRPAPGAGAGEEPFERSALPRLIHPTTR